MLCKQALLLGIFSFLLRLGSNYAQTVQSIKGTNSDSCNVVNVQFGNVGSEDDRPTNVKSGPPGKRGVAGPMGLKGQKGNKGDIGDKGPPINATEIKNEVFDALSSSSCSELRDNHGISKAGYYWLRKSRLSSNHGSFIYCDFKTYGDVSTCTELTTKYNVTIYGYYILGNSSEFQYCPDIHTCHHLVQRDGITETGFYQVGSPGDQYTVHCNVFSGDAVTELLHDSMNEIKASDCESNGCYTRRPQYIVPMDKMIKVINHSKRCRQFIEFKCLSAVLLYHPKPPRGYWLSREGESMKYWGGASSKRPGYCACGETGTCVNRQKKCNCDVNSGPITSDNGYLTDKTKLPVSEMRFGDMGSSDEKGWHTLGKLECVGEA